MEDGDSGARARAREELDMAGPAAPHCDVATDRKKATRTYLTILLSMFSMLSFRMIMPVKILKCDG